MKKSFTKLGLVLCGAALSLLQPLNARAADDSPFFKNDNGRVSFLVDANPGGGYQGQSCLVDLDGKTAALDIPTFQIRGQLWGLMGELVQAYEAKYSLGHRLYLPLSGNITVQNFINLPNGPGGVAYCLIQRSLAGTGQAKLEEPVETPAGGTANQKHYVLSVSSDLFDEIAISAFFDMQIDFLFTGASGGMVKRQYPGILGHADEWGWDVPGSPDWAKAFWYDSLTPMDKSHATNLWQNLKTKPHSVNAKVSGLSIGLWNFRTALAKANPAAAAKLSQAMSGYSSRAYFGNEAGSAALRAAAQQVTAGLQTGKPLPAEIIAAATQTATSASQSPKTKEMAERMVAVLKLGTKTMVADGPAVTALLMHGKFDIALDVDDPRGGKFSYTIQTRKNPTSGLVEFCISQTFPTWCNAKLDLIKDSWLKLGGVKRLEVDGYRFYFRFRNGILNNAQAQALQEDGFGDNNYVIGLCNSKGIEWGEGVAKYLQDALNELHPEDK